MLQLIGPHFQAFLISIIRISLWLAILVMIFVPLEQLFAVHPRKVFRKGIGVDLGYYFLSSLLPALLLSLPLGLLAWAVRHFVPGGLLAATASLPLWARALAGLVAGEIGYYWGHRLSHEIPFLWRFHSIHHSAEHVDFLVNSRAHPIDMVFGKFCGLVPLYVLGLGGPLGPSDSLVPILVGLFGMTWGFFIHANLGWRFGPLEWLISTPAFHHWHHTRSGPINRNYASMLPWLDRIFGTLHLPNEWPADYGIKAKLPDSLVGQLVYPVQPWLSAAGRSEAVDTQAPVVGLPEAAEASRETGPYASPGGGPVPGARIETLASQ
jgi:sterol desaturase/sphingolipid hydroxylase (fatty acid hydroxylase superfamily)